MKFLVFIFLTGCFAAKPAEPELDAQRLLKRVRLAEKLCAEKRNGGILNFTAKTFQCKNGASFSK